MEPMARPARPGSWNCWNRLEPLRIKNGTENVRIRFQMELKLDRTGTEWNRPNPNHGNH